MTDEGTYRVLPGESEGAPRFLDRKTFEPVGIQTGGHDTSVADLRPGYLVEANLDWSTADPTVESVDVVRPTLYAFADGVEPMFEAARETWEAAQASGDAMNTRVVNNTDNQTTGVVYVFAESGDRGRFEEFRDGDRPLEPLVDQVNERGDPAPREVFVLRPTSGNYTVVTIALRKGGQLAETMRDTYDCPRPSEPLVDVATNY